LLQTAHSKVLKSIAIIWENQELLDILVGEFERDLNVGYVIDHLIRFGNVAAAIEVIASHFSQFSDLESHSDSS
jgi:hypothetical protein